MRSALAEARTQWQVSHGGGFNPLWSNGRQELVDETLNREIARVAYVMRGDQFVPGPPRLWPGVHLPAGEGSYSMRNFDLSRDGRRLLTLDEPNPPASLAPAGITLLLNFFDELRRRVPVVR